MEYHHGHDPFMSVTDELLRDILHELKESNRLLMLNDHYLRRILDAVTPKFPTSFSIRRSSMVPLDPGQSPQFTATPQPDGSSLGSVIPTWTTSDSTNAPISVDPTGLIVTVTQLGAAGSVITLTVSATSTDGTQTATGSTTFTIGSAPSQFPTSFGVAQSA